MAPPTEEEPLEELLRALADRDRRALVEEAAAEARAEAKRILRERLVAFLLEGAEAPAPGTAHPPDRARPDDRPGVEAVVDALQKGAGHASAPAPEAAGPAPDGSAGTGLYVYGIVEPSSQLPASMPPGLGGGAEVSLLPADGVQAVVSEVPLSRFGREALGASLEDPEWLEAAVRTHEAVLAHLHGAGTVLPLRFGTVFGDEGRAREVLAARGHDFQADLARLRGRSEWGVKVLSDWAALVAWLGDNDEEIARLRSESEGATEGRAFFLRRRMERSLATEATRLQGEVAAEVHRRLSAVAEDSVAPEATGIGDTPGLLVAAAAYLVEGPREGELRRAVEDLQSLYGPAGFTLRLTGPWAPYSFAASTRSDGTD